jgi:hypothetical protein
MWRSPALARMILSAGRWLLPWLIVLLLSASLAFDEHTPPLCCTVRR